MGNILLALEEECSRMVCYTPRLHLAKFDEICARRFSTAHSAVSPARLTANPPASRSLHSLTILLLIFRGVVACCVQRSATAKERPAPSFRFTCTPLMTRPLFFLLSRLVGCCNPSPAKCAGSPLQTTTALNVGLRIQFPAHPRYALPLPPRPNPLPQTPTPSNVCLTWAGGIRGVRVSRSAPQQCKDRMRGLRVAGNYFTCAAAGFARTAARGLSPMFSPTRATNARAALRLVY